MICIQTFLQLFGIVHYSEAIKTASVQMRPQIFNKQPSQSRHPKRKDPALGLLLAPHFTSGSGGDWEQEKAKIKNISKLQRNHLNLNNRFIYYKMKKIFSNYNFSFYAFCASSIYCGVSEKISLLPHILPAA